MRTLRNNDTKRQFDVPDNLIQPFESEEPMNSFFEPFVDADAIAAFIGEPRKIVVRMAREGKLTSYPISGRKRHVYKFRRSEVVKDLEKYRQPSSAANNNHDKDSFQKR